MPKLSLVKPGDTLYDWYTYRSSDGVLRRDNRKVQVVSVDLVARTVNATVDGGPVQTLPEAKVRRFRRSPGLRGKAPRWR